MGWAENKVTACEKMIVELRRTIAGEYGDVEWIPTQFLADIDQIITTTEIAVSAGYLPFGVAPEPEPEPDLDMSEAKLLARWLWDRGLTIHDVAHTTDRVVASAGLPGVDPQAWVMAADLMDRLEVRATTEPDLPMLARHHMNDRAQWLGLPAPSPAEPTTAPADPFRHGSVAEANRLAKAKTLARWLWDRGIDGDTLLDFTDKYRREIARTAGVNPPSSLTTWSTACSLITHMELREAAEPEIAAVARHHLAEREQWATDPHAART